MYGGSLADRYDKRKILIATQIVQIASAAVLEDGTIELGFRGDDQATARLLRAAVRSGLAIVTFSRAASDLEELFLQVTGAVPEVPSVPVVVPPAGPNWPGITT